MHADTVHVALAIIVREGRVLICRRRTTGPLAGYWEFPGGKCETGENPADATRREAAEELGVTVEVDRALTPRTWVYPHAKVTLHPFLCRLISGQPQALASDELRWATPGQLIEVSFPPANTPLVHEVVQALSAPA